MPEYVQYQDALWRSVLEVRPGITDAATLVFRDEEQLLQSTADADAYYRATLLPAKLRIALRYRESRSLPRDLTLLWLTARYSLFPRNFDRERVMRALGAEAPERNETLHSDTFIPFHPSIGDEEVEKWNPPFGRVANDWTTNRAI